MPPNLAPRVVAIEQPVMPIAANERGYAPSGGLGVIAFVVLVMLAIGQL